MNQLSALPFEYIVGYYNGKKKDFKGITKNWTIEQAQNMLERLEQDGENVLGIMRNIQLQNQGIVCIDIDEDIHYIQMIQAYPVLKNTLYVPGNTKGGHFYFKTDWKGKQNYVNCFDQLKGDLIIIQMFEKEGKEWLDKRIQTITAEQLQDMVEEKHRHVFDDTTDSESVTSTESVAPSTVSFSAIPFGAFERSILDNISPEYYTAYDVWLKFIWAIKYSDFADPLSIADEYSKRLDNYVSKDDVRKFMEQAKEKRISWSYLMNLSKKSNLYNHKVILGDRYVNIPVITEYHHAHIALDLIDDIVKKNNCFYIYKHGYWVQDTTNKECDVKVKLIDTIRKFWTDVQKRYTTTKDTEDETVQRKLHKIGLCILNCCKADMCNNMAHFYKIYLPETEEVFDNKPYLFCFKNCAFNLQTGLPYTVLKSDYITQHTGNDYVPPTQSQTNLMHTLLSQIFPCPEVRACYLSVLCRGMTGIQEEKFFVANGKGRNGKGLLNEIYMDLIGDQYGYVLPIDILTSKMDIGSGANPQIANCHNKRFIISREPPENAKIKTSILKELTGCQTINARQLHSGNCKVVLKQVQLLECNEKLQLSGTMNDAILDRIVDIPFVSHFTEVDEADTINHIYPINKLYKTNEWREEHRCALFNIILQGHRELYIPKKIKDLSKEYVMSSDEIYAWIKETYDVGTNDDIIKTKDLYMAFCDSAVYRQFSKDEKRLMTKKKFVSMIANSVSFKGQYKVNEKMINGVRYDERLHGWKVREEVDEFQEL
jgi:phage/plasmid-associated DNA primase